jgi:hypothetical protein
MSNHVMAQIARRRTRAVVPAIVFALIVATAAVIGLSADQRGAARPSGAPQTPRDNSLKPGDLAPDFTLTPRGGGASVTLSAFRGRQPVALVFGSYT